MSGILGQELHRSIGISRFPRSILAANIIPVFKKDDQTDKANYRPISILPNLSKVLEDVYKTNSILYLIEYFLFSKVDFQCSTSYYQTYVKWKQCLDKGLVSV